MVSWNIEGLYRQERLLPKLWTKFSPDYIFLQETKTSTMEESSFRNNITKKGKRLFLSSWDKFETEFIEQLRSSQRRAKHGTGILQVQEEDILETDTGNHRFQIISNKESILVNVYMPTDNGVDGAVELEQAVDDRRQPEQDHAR